MQKKELNSSGMETEGVYKQMGGYNPGSLHVGYNTRASLAIQPEIPFSQTYSQVWSKDPKTQENMMASEVRSMLSQGTIKVCPGNVGFFTYSFLILKKNGKATFYLI